MIRSSALKAFLGAILFASFITVGCNNGEKEEAKEPAKTEEATPATTPAPAATDTTKKVEDSAAGKPGAPGN